ncbi:MAG: hypothetical protein AAB733_00065 [Patescibacteria group bacterium]
MDISYRGIIPKMDGISNKSATNAERVLEGEICIEKLVKVANVGYFKKLTLDKRSGVC